MLERVPTHLSLTLALHLSISFFLLASFKKCLFRNVVAVDAIAREHILINSSIKHCIRVFEAFYPVYAHVYASKLSNC